jgi:hypothetical protein
MAEIPTGWQLLHSKLPAAAIKSLPKDVYGVAGLSDVNEGFLIQRLFASGLSWEWRIVRQDYLGAEDRAVRDKDYTQRYYLFSVQGDLTIEGRMFHGSGASDNRKVDAAAKGAATVAFKNACKLAGLTIELYKDGKAMDHIYEARQMSKAETVDEALKEITDTFGDPAQPAQSTAPLAAVDPADGANIASVVPASDEADDERQDLYVLARTLKIPRTVLEVNNKIAKQSLTAVRRELILAHARDHGPACLHVAELAGLKN